MEQEFVIGQDEDSTEQLPNITANLQAYRSKKLVRYPKLVTYWSNGEQLCEQRPFDWDEFEVLNQAHGGHKGFWREGVSIGGSNLGLRSHSQSLVKKVGPGSQALRLPGYQWWVELPFMYDTGASCMSIYHGDLNMLMGPPRIPPKPLVPRPLRLILHNRLGRYTDERHRNRSHPPRQSRSQREKSNTLDSNGMYRQAGLLQRRKFNA
ncbi:hypothetical protein PENSUB_5620 [Penicillium subrubescens]|uniref:Uncharacterized protein n=1 Tax=Penicillium subrubescens TaxID=1316194 RepID=A0A1Q5U6Z2_9EURO|nr:hypothetical protein PENSUB_5620 [Penicillium subrubescens]